MMTMTKREASRRLIDALVEDQIGSYRGDTDGWQQLENVFRTGFKGFENMSDAELISCAHDSGLSVEYKEEVEVLEASV